MPKFAFCKLYDRKNALVAADILNDKVDSFLISINSWSFAKAKTPKLSGIADSTPLKLFTVIYQLSSNTARTHKTIPLKKAKCDFNSLIHGEHDGKLVTENITLKLTCGKRKIIGETFKDTVQFKNAIEG